MTHKVILISHIIRGRLHSAERRNDIYATRRIIEAMRKSQPEEVFTAPYLLYAEIGEDVVGARIRTEGWFHNPPQELWLFGPVLCDGMRGEIARMRSLSLPVVFKTLGLG